MPIFYLIFHHFFDIKSRTNQQKNIAKNTYDFSCSRDQSQGDFHPVKRGNNMPRQLFFQAVIV